MIRWVMLAIFLSTAQTQSISSQGPMDVTTVMVSSKSPYPNPVSTHHTSVGPALTATGKTAMTGSVVNTGQASTTSSSRGSTQSATDEYQDTTSTPLLVVLVITELIINEPDDKWIQSDGGQALDFTVTVSSTSYSSHVSGDDNWTIQAFVASVDNGNPSSPVIQAQLSDVYLTADLPPGGNYTFSDIGIALDLTKVSCSIISHFCVMVDPSTSANWSLDPQNSTHVKCVGVYCTDGGNQIGPEMNVMILLPIIAYLCSKP